MKANVGHTTGILAMWNGTKDGEEAYVDYSTGSSNLDGLNNVPILAQDIRSMEPRPKILSDGLELVPSTTSLTGEQLLAGDAEQGRKLIEDVYFEEIRSLLTSVTNGCKVIFPYAYRVRRSDSTPEDFTVMRLRLNSIPVAHVDRDPTNAPVRLLESLGEELGQSLMKKHKRWAQVNVWRPINEHVQKWPLAFVDQTSVKDWAYETHTAPVHPRNDPRTDLKFSLSHETILKHDKGYSYRYASHVTPEESLIFFSYHTDPQMVRPHAAFWDTSSRPDAPARCSIEVRSWIFWD